MRNRQLNTVCNSTWNRLERSVRFGVSQGEETITDCILLFLAQHGGKSNCIRVVDIRTTNKHEEHEEGIDWEWWIGNDHEKWLRYAVQAKKLDLKERRFEKQKYLSLKYEKGVAMEKRQSEVLRKYAEDDEKNRAIPIYALYNYVHEYGKPSPDYRHCCQKGVRRETLGVTVTPLSNIQLALRARDRSFANIHRDCTSIPLRCLACRHITCTRHATANTRSAWTAIRENATRYERLPKFYEDLFGQDSYAINAEYIQHLRRNIDLREHREYFGRKNFPKRIGFIFVPIND